MNAIPWTKRRSASARGIPSGGPPRPTTKPKPSAGRAHGVGCARARPASHPASKVLGRDLRPRAGRGRTFALRQLKSLAEQHGYTVRERRVYYAESA